MRPMSSTVAKSSAVVTPRRRPSTAPSIFTKNYEVEAHRPIPDIFEIERQPVPKGQVLTPRYLCRARDPRKHAMPLALLRCQHFEVHREQGAGAHEGHLASGHVP